MTLLGVNLGSEFIIFWTAITVIWRAGSLPVVVRIRPCSVVPVEVRVSAGGYGLRVRLLLAMKNVDFLLSSGMVVRRVVYVLRYFIC